MPVRRDERMLLSTYLTDWLQRIRPTAKPLTWERYETLLRHVPETMGKTPLAKLSPTQVERLYADCLEVGLSPTTAGELLALHWRDVDLGSGVLQVRGTLHRVAGVSVSAVGEKSGLVISDPKTAHSRRPVRLSARSGRAEGAPKAPE